MGTKNIDLDGTSIPIQKFKLESMCPNPSICMIAKRASGKSWVCRALLHHFRNIPVGIIIAPTDKMSSFYGKFFPGAYIYYEYKSEIIENLMARQKIMIAKAKKKYLEGKKCDPRAILLMDDCLSSKGSWMRDKPIMQLFFDGRHYQIMYILTMQFPLGISPELRSNFDYIFLLADDFCSNQKRLYEHYAGMFPHFNAFRDVFIELTVDYGSMVISNRGSRKNFLEKIFYFKADEIPLEKIGCKQFIEFDKNNVDPMWDSGRGIHFDIDKLMDKKNKTKIKVSKMVDSEKPS